MIVVDFRPDDIRGLLVELDQRLRASEVAAVLYLVGGAALALGGMDARRTRDVDGVVVPEAPVLAEASALARERGIPVSWLSTAAQQWVPGPAPQLLRPPGKPGLIVHRAPEDHLLAMKLVAFRRQDFDDIVYLAAVLGLTAASAKVFADLLDRVYGEALRTVLGPGDQEALSTGERAVALLTRPDTPVDEDDRGSGRFPPRGRRRRRSI